jgi:hypothetical protein
VLLLPAIIGALLKKLCQALAETLFAPSINDRASCNFRVLPPSDNWSLCRRLPVWEINNQPIRIA